MGIFLLCKEKSFSKMLYLRSFLLAAPTTQIIVICSSRHALGRYFFWYYASRKDDGTGTAGKTIKTG